jgi:multidrug resistance efflux pump
LLDVQIGKLAVKTPTGGVVLDQPLNVGEMASPGATVVQIGNLDDVTLTVYIPENQYGNVKLGQKAVISVDTFPGKTFEGTVHYISDQAEFTPRNVQTVESRSTTVYAVKIKIPNPDHSLKPGMPADAEFSG